ncbi:hypothetical protein ACFS07_36090 [Undibacterium arcticum]
MKVAELVSVRHAYMSSVLEASMLYVLEPAIQDEYALVSNGFFSPIDSGTDTRAKKRFGELLRPVLSDAQKILGKEAREQAAAGVSRGEVISQNSEFTVQDIGDGRIVAHENRRLAAVPAVGSEVTVAYYRGKGQVISDMKDVAIGKVYVEAKSGDLAVNLANVDGDIKHVVMFGSMAMVSEFASEHGLGKDFVREAMDVRTASPKISPNQSKREIAGEPYIDPLTDSLALDYRENGIKFTVVFGSAKEFEANAHQFGASEEIISIAYQMESLAHPGMQSQDQKNRMRMPSPS